ncbi:general secretion pathway protein E [Hyphomicrobium facile]|uniref:General secretion pathway protein E n=1 Tax=Hyphomicrobium facile TaxID=51670 RepID=A0A1I7N4M7_9HYPH|nr:general secretion pathway protein E [Hyphomicrobium facile]
MTSACHSFATMSAARCRTALSNRNFASRATASSGSGSAQTPWPTVDGTQIQSARTSDHASVAREDAPAFEDYLLERGLISRSDFDKVERFRRETGATLRAALRKSSALTTHALVHAVAEYHGVRVVREDQWLNQPSAFSSISHAFLRENKVLPLEGVDGAVLLAMEDPSDVKTINAVRLALERPIIPLAASAEDIQNAIEHAARRRDAPSVWTEAPTETSGDDVEHLRDMALGAPVVRFVNQMLKDAVHARATDIHIEPFDGLLAIRMRVDGMLRDTTPPPSQMSKAIISRIKILSGLNIAERRLPQDGRARIRVDDHRLDLRIATIPTIHGEAVAIRLLDNVRRVLDFSALGFSPRDENVIRKELSAPYGLILVTGPTGSGKTTTLATALSVLNQSHRKILSIEDPIEYEIKGVNQTQAKPAIGLTFASALRSFLRHDPDVMMVGEMRDAETASIGIHAALTGHLVLSTLHTNTAAGAIPRLLDMGIDAFLLASSLRCVIGQRLVRVLCSHCKKLAAAPEEAFFSPQHRSTASALAVQEQWHAVGCDRCFGTGYSDRIVIAEVLDVDDEIRNLIQPNARPAAIEDVACRNGMTKMITDGLAKCRAGLTTPEEVRRVALDI